MYTQDSRFVFLGEGDESFKQAQDFLHKLTAG